MEWFVPIPYSEIGCMAQNFWDSIIMFETTMGQCPNPHLAQGPSVCRSMWYVATLSCPESAVQ